MFVFCGVEDENRENTENKTEGITTTTTTKPYVNIL